MEELSEGVDPDLAAAMGFSSFGSKNKRRRDTAGDNQPINIIGKSASPVGDTQSTSMTSEGEGTLAVATASPAPATTSLKTPDIQAIKPDNTESREAIYQRQPETPFKGDHQLPKAKRNKRRSPVPTGLAAFLVRGHALPERPETSASLDQSVQEPSAAPASTSGTAPYASLPASAPASNANAVPLSLGRSAQTNSKPILEKTLEELTPQDLQALTYGVPNENGVVVFFQMNFFEDPWERLRKGG